MPGKVHLMPRDREWWAVPAGLAMLIGQLLNTLGPVQTYEHISTEGVGVYVPSSLLTPSTERAILIFATCVAATVGSDKLRTSSSAALSALSC